MGIRQLAGHQRKEYENVRCIFLESRDHEMKNYIKIPHPFLWKSKQNYNSYVFYRKFAKKLRELKQLFNLKNLKLQQWYVISSLTRIWRIRVIKLQIEKKSLKSQKIADFIADIFQDRMKSLVF